MTFVLVPNSGSGLHDAERLGEHLRDRLRAAGKRCECIEPRVGEDLVERMAIAARLASSIDGALIAIGGDGTVNLAADAALRNDLPLGIVPRGTYNFVARAHGIPEDVDAAVSNLLESPARPTRVGRLNGRPFLVNASIGLYARLLSERETFSRRLGRRRAVASLAATVSALRRHRPLELTLGARGAVRRLAATTFIVGNNRLQLERVGVADLPDLDAPEMSAVILHPAARTTLLAMIWRGWLGDVAETRELETFLFDTLQVDVPRRRARRITVALDGERLRETLPLEFSLDLSLRLIRAERTGR